MEPKNLAGMVTGEEGIYIGTNEVDPSLGLAIDGEVRVLQGRN
jgi:hypothetical protein